MLVKDIVNLSGQEVILRGWVNGRRDHGKIIFIDLRDRSGLVQLVFIAKNKELYEKADALRPEWVIEITGQVNERPANMKNPEISTGDYEVLVSGLKIIHKAETLPIDIYGDGYSIGEEVRMKYRYLDLRRPRLAENLRARFKLIKYIRDFLTKEDFVEIETPILGRSTPEGARDYLVPSRVYPGKFYALPQSPQQYKQLLMVAGFERYFQIARCFRDEDTRGDRQPEFTQLDLEMSFVEEEDVLSLIEKLFLGAFKDLYPDKKLKLAPDGRFLRMTYQEAMKNYKSDRPDLRDNPDDPNELAPLFVVDFPMFEWKETENRWDAVHHPFTQPKVKGENGFEPLTAEEFKKAFQEDPAQIYAYQYDFVLNGYEVGGGSIRIHDPELLAAVFEAMGNPREEVIEKFGHILEAFRYGVPPHGGMAPGIDRLVMVLQNEPNIREVIAFPKTGDGRDLMMGAPAPVDQKQLDELGLKINKLKGQND